jgi:hypothetical protein
VGSGTFPYHFFLYKDLSLVWYNTWEDTDSLQIREAIHTESEENQKYLSVIEGAAFIVCLDDSSPETPEEVVRSFYLGDGFNRWFDCGIQFIIASNGVSGTLVNHAMIDGLTIHRVNEWITEALRANMDSSLYQNGVSHHLEEYSCTMAPSIEQRINEVRRQHLDNTSKLEFLEFGFTQFGKEFLLANNSPIKGVLDLITQLAARLYFGYNPPSWEAVSMSQFHRGRPEGVQVVTEAVEKFCASALVDEVDVSTRHRLLIEAVKEYGSNIRNASLGKHYRRTFEVMRHLLDKDDPIPALFTNPVYLKIMWGGMLRTSMTDGGSRVSAYAPRDADQISSTYSISENG